MSRSTISSLPLPPAVLIDTGLFYALVDANEDKTQSRHSRAKAIFESLAASGTKLYTTDLVIAESQALILNRLKRIDKALDFINDIYSSNSITIVHVTTADHAKARALLNQYNDKSFTQTDATSFVVMDRLHLTHALTFDRNFRQYGFIMLPSEE